MYETTSEFKCIVWILNTAIPPHHLTVEAHDEADAERQLVKQFGECIHCSVWNEEDMRRRFPERGRVHDKPRKFKAIFWTADPEKPGQRTTVWALSGAEAGKMLAEQYGEDITCSVWNAEDSNRTR